MGLLFFILLFGLLLYRSLQLACKKRVVSYQARKDVPLYPALCLPPEALAFGDLHVQNFQLRLHVFHNWYGISAQLNGA